uniref:Uncharacterized protein n=1 Tax=Plectus sambesii TaxID=2011161 RepID=A0A914WQ72_9BILA
MAHLFGLALVLAAVLIRIDACFIQQCPFTIGLDSYESGKIKKDSGVFKRSLPQFLQLRQCAMCSDGIRIGQCFGPAICCFGDGCVIGKNLITMNCLMESVSSKPCLPHGAKSCSTGSSNDVKQGFCSSPDLCCSNDTCVVSRQCEERDGVERAMTEEA